MPTALSYTQGNIIVVHGYEVPKGTCKQARNVLRKLRRYGFVMFEHDDGPSLCTRLELEAIADAIGLMQNHEPYCLSLVDAKGKRKFTYKGAASLCS